MQNFTAALLAAERIIHQAEQSLAVAEEAWKDEERKQLKALLERLSNVEKELRKQKEQFLGDLLDLAVVAGIKDCYIPIGPCYVYEIRSAKEIKVSVAPGNERRAQNEDHAVSKIHNICGFVSCRRLWFYEFCGGILQQIEILLRDSPHIQDRQLKTLTNLKKKLGELAQKSYPQAIS